MIAAVKTAASASLEARGMGVDSTRPSRFARWMLTPAAALVSWICLSSALRLLRWSTLDTPLLAATWALLALTLALGLTLMLRVPDHRSEPASKSLPYPSLAILLVYGVAASIENEGLPTLQVIDGADYDVYSFGLPGLHVPMLALLLVTTVRICYRLVTSPRWTSALALAACFAATALMASRSTVMFLLFGCIYIYVRTIRISWRRIPLICAIAAVALYLFGSFGNVRLLHQIQQQNGAGSYGDVTYVFTRASHNFDATGLPVDWMWAYTYITSPLTNLNAAIGYSQADVGYFGQRWAELLVFDMLPNSFGNEIADWLDLEPLSTLVFLPVIDLTASTMFGRAIATGGMMGGVLLLCQLALTYILAMYVANRWPDGEVIKAVLATLLFFQFFDNMVAYSPVSLALCLTVAQAWWASMTRKARIKT